MTVVFISTMIFITAPITSTSIVSNVNAAGKEGPGYICSHIPGTGTIGQTKCCSTGGDTMYCTICDDTSPPSNCQPRTVGKFDSGTVLHSNEGGVLSQNDDSGNTGDSNTVSPDNAIEEGTFNDDSGSSNTGDSGEIDSNKINSGAVFNQQ